MHHGTCLVVLGWAACGFQGPSVPGDAARDAANPADAPLDDAARPDAPDAPPGCKVWAADFAVDPLTLDDNGDGQPDWRPRTQATLPGQLVNGVWEVPGGSAALDTNPQHDFLGITTVTARMRCIAGGGLCATLFANVGYNDGDGEIGAVFVDIRLEGANQAVILNQRRDNLPPVELDRTVHETLDFIDVTLEIDEPMRRVTLELPQFGYVKANTQYEELATTASDRYVSLFAGRDAEFDAISVTSCPPR